MLEPGTQVRELGVFDQRGNLRTFGGTLGVRWDTFCENCFSSRRHRSRMRGDLSLAAASVPWAEQQDDQNEDDNRDDAWHVRARGNPRRAPACYKSNRRSMVGCSSHRPRQTSPSRNRSSGRQRAAWSRGSPSPSVRSAGSRRTKPSAASRCARTCRLPIAALSS